MKSVLRSISTFLTLIVFLSERSIVAQEKVKDQVRISGWASDFCGDPIRFAVLTLVPATGGVVVATRTDDEGAFAFSPTAPGIYDLRLEAPGLDPFIESINATEAKDIEEKELLVVRVGLFTCPSASKRVRYKKSPLPQSLTRSPTEVGQRGIVKVGDQCSVALDGGKVECMITLDGDGTEPKQHPTGKEWDFWIEVAGKAHYLRPQNRTMFANTGTTEPSKAGCQGVAYKRDRIRIDKLPSGSHVCVLTGRRQYAELTLESAIKSPSDPLLFAYIFWE